MAKNSDRTKGNESSFGIKRGKIYENQQERYTWITLIPSERLGFAYI
jgi:hypothetical protein